MNLADEASSCMRRLFPLWFAMAISVAVAACGSSPPSTFYALGPTQGSAKPLDLHRVLIRRPGIAGYLDRPEIVFGQQDFRLRIANSDRWAEPLDAMIARVLALDLGSRLSGSSVFTDEGAITADPDATVEVNVERLDIGDGGDVNLVAEVAITRGANRTPLEPRSIRLRAAPQGASTSALVATMSSLLGELADQISVVLRGA
jgi:uncharacterized lipoprotein YmbA